MRSRGRIALTNRLFKRRGTQKDKFNIIQNSNKQTQVAFILSIYSTLFVTYQWWKNQESELTKQSIDIANKYLENKEIYRQADAVFRWEKSDEPWYNGQTFDNKDLQDRWNYMYYMEYIAGLIGSGKLNLQFIPKPLLCRIYIAGSSNKKLHSEGRIPPEFRNIDFVAANLTQNPCNF